MLRMVSLWFLFLLSWAVPAQTVKAPTTEKITFNLVSPSGEVSEKDYAGKYLLMAVGYTSCPDICPTTLYEFGRTVKDLNNPDAVQILFVTIDPMNDDVKRLNAYTNYFDPRIIGLTGEMKNIQALADQLGATFGYRKDGKKVDDPKRGEVYEVYHSAYIYLISPEREIIDVFDYQIGERLLTEALNEKLPAAEGAKKAETGSASPSPTSTATLERPKLSCPLPAGFDESKKITDIHDFVPDAKTDKPIVLNLWALWCAPCRQELPVLERLRKSDDNLYVETLNLNDAAEPIGQLFSELELTQLSQRSTQEKDVLERLGAVGLPFSALFVEGKQVGVKIGIINSTEALSQFGQCQKNSSIHQQ